MRLEAVFSAVLTVCLAVPATGQPQTEPLTSADYDRAAAMLQVGELLYNETLTPRWIGDSDRFWYRSDDADGARFWLVEPLARTERKRLAFDHEQLAASLSRLRGDATEPLALPFQDIDLSEPGRVGFRMEEDQQPVAYSCATSGLDCKRTPPESGDAEDAETAGQGDPVALWSPDGSKILTYRLDQRAVGSLHLIQSSGLTEGARPVLHSYRYPLPGDQAAATSELLIIDTATAKVTSVETEPAHTPYISLIDFQQLWWSESGDAAFLLRRERGSRRMALERIDARSGSVKTLLAETSEHLVEPNLTIGARPNVRVLQSQEVIWYSERDGYAHLYLYGADGELVRQLTRGSWVVRDLHHVDEDARTLYFSASGVEQGVDPYLRKLYSASLDSTTAQPAELTPEPGDHTVTFSPTGKSFVDVFSQIDQPTRSLARPVAGSGDAVDLEQADFSRLLEAAGSYPMPFEAKARDGKTPIYGTVILPPDFDPAAEPGSYPVIDGIYPGPQASRVAKNWHGPLAFLGTDLSLAQLGFVVVSVDGFGTPFRSRSFHNRSEGNLQEAGGLPDHLAAIRQLAALYPQMDLERVGVYGHSGGGFAAARAIFAYPDFYKVAVSSAGNHDQRGYLQLWGEQYHGDPATVSYQAQANASIAHQLEGKLLLAYGALDDNVHPALTLQVIDALTRANKDYDLIVMPRGNHGFAADPYFRRRLWDYFVRHLAGREPPVEYSLASSN